MSHFLMLGTILGMSAGLAPGPLLTLVISETLQHNIKSGVKVALAPIITDLPIIILTLFLLSKLSNFHSILGIISLIGSFFIVFMGYQNLRTKRNGEELRLENMRENSLQKGIIANFLSPTPYLFWLSIGAPTMTKAINQGVIFPLTFLISFYAFLVGTKIMLAILVGKSKTFLSGNACIFTMRFVGLLLCGLAAILFHDGLKLLEIP